MVKSHMVHTPVLLKEVMSALDPQKGDAVIDGTAGAGGHAKEIAGRIGEGGKMLLVDWDEETALALEKEVRSFSNASVVQGNYADIPALMERSDFPKADALLLDLGFSSDQLLRGRGFSFSPKGDPSAGGQKADEPLLMTYSGGQEPLRDVLRRISEKELCEVIREFGEERYAEEIAHAIVAHRADIRTSGALADVIRGAVPKSYERGRIHPATRTFQALRIYINKELENLERVLGSLPEIVRPGGRVAIISFHSLEDRIVKERFQKMEKEGQAKIITKKPIAANFEEVARNPRARSAKLRAIVIL